MCFKFFPVSCEEWSLLRHCFMQIVRILTSISPQLPSLPYCSKVQYTCCIIHARTSGGWCRIIIIIMFHFFSGLPEAGLEKAHHWPLTFRPTHALTHSTEEYSSWAHLLSGIILLLSAEQTGTQHVGKQFGTWIWNDNFSLGASHSYCGHFLYFLQPHG